MGDEKGEEKSFLEHLEELRKRLIYCIIACGASFALALPFSSKLLTIFLKPISVNQGFIFTKPAEGFLVHLKLSLYIALFLSFPFIIWQIWKFVAPGLYRHEKRKVLPLLTSSSVLFVAGGLFGYFVVLPKCIAFLVKTFSSEVIRPLLSISEFLTFAVRFLFAFGIAFLTPIFTLALVKLGIVERSTLVRARKYIILGAFAFAAILTPPDAISQVALAIPLVVLWEIGLILSRIT